MPQLILNHVDLRNPYCFLFCLISYFCWRNSTRSYNAEILQVQLLKFHFSHWSYEKGGKKICLLYSFPSIVWWLDALHVILYGTCLLSLRNHPILFKFLNTSLTRNLLKFFEDPSQMPLVRALILFYLLWVRHFQAMVGTQWATSLGSVNGIWALHLGNYFRPVFLTDESVGWCFMIFQKETKSQEYFSLVCGQFFFQVLLISTSPLLCTNWRCQKRL